jgi:2-polyprenyl-6-methoxyphenol hydroxylase-like FAD-dependent oxidoreductase
MLDLHPDTGLAAIAACGLKDEFDARTVECAEASIVADMDGSVLWRAEGNGTQPEISRHALTKLLLSKLPDECIRWEHKLLSARASASSEGADANEFTLDFGSQEGGPVTADLVIGADGAWSRTRPLLTDRVPHYSGRQMITVTVPELTRRYPSLEAVVGSGSLIAVGDGNAIIGQRGLQGAARLYLVISTEDVNLASSSGLDRLSASEVKDVLLRPNGGGGGEGGRWRNFGGWGQEFKELITRALEDHAATGEALDIKPMYMLPLGKLAWPHRAGVTLLGDAAHLMTPFGGEGVNLALKDALDLAGAITQAWDASNGENDVNVPSEKRNVFKAALDPLIEDSEKSMIARGDEAAAQTWSNLQAFFGKDAAKTIAALFQGFEG